jgi:hypothetical protein
MSTQSVNSGIQRQDLYRLLVVAGFGLALGILGTLALQQFGAPSPAGASANSQTPAAALVLATPSPQASSSPPPTAPPSATPSPSPRPSPTPKPSPKPSLGPVDLNLAPNGNAVFSSQITKEWCAPAGLTSALAIMRLVKASDAVQRQLESRIRGWTTYADSHNGGWGPLAMTKALAAYGAPGYVVQTFKTRDAALRAAGIALSATREPVLLLAWWGAHTWVMSGYRATGNLALDPRATFTGAYIVDPWYPRVSSIWGHVNPPGHFYNMAGMKRNFIAWTRPEGRYPGRDGRWVVVLPTRALHAVNG